MGAYTWLTEQEFERYSSVEDKEINEALEEVRRLMPEWYVSERFQETKRIFSCKRICKTYYTVYRKTKPDYTEVRFQLSCVTKSDVLNLLYGLFMGYNSKQNTITNGLSCGALREEIWGMLNDDCKISMQRVKESYLDSIMADIDSYAGNK